MRSWLREAMDSSIALAVGRAQQASNLAQRLCIIIVVEYDLPADTHTFFGCYALCSARR
jgi:hypothetical protein